MKAPRILVATLAALAAFTFTAQAAVVTWGAATDIAGDADVSTSGSLVMAFNFGDPAVTGTTVNGVTFDPFALLTNDSQLSYTVGNATLSTTDDRGPRGATTSTWQALPPGYTSLLTSAAELIADRSYTLTLSGLTVGQEYKFQMWVNNSDREYFGYDFPTYVDDGNGNGEALYTGDNGLNGGGQGVNAPPRPGQYIIGTFTADASFQDFLMGGSEISGVVNGFQLREAAPAAPPVTPIPEPGSALVGALVLGLCGLGSARRRG
jgi:hypothetical protein